MGAAARFGEVDTERLSILVDIIVENADGDRALEVVPAGPVDAARGGCVIAACSRAVRGAGVVVTAAIAHPAADRIEVDAYGAVPTSQTLKGHGCRALELGDLHGRRHDSQ